MSQFRHVRARALGHSVLSCYGLSTEPEFTLLDLADAFQILGQQVRQRGGPCCPNVRWQTLLFEARQFDTTLQQKFPEKNHHHSRGDDDERKRADVERSRTTTADGSEVLAYVEDEEDDDDDGSSSVVVVLDVDTPKEEEEPLTRDPAPAPPPQVETQQPSVPAPSPSPTDVPGGDMRNLIQSCSLFLILMSGK